MSIETMTKLATYTVGATSEATVTFSNIPQTYSDLKLIVSARSNRASNTIDNGWIYFNNDTTSTNYTKRRMWGDGSTSYSATTYDLDYYVQGSTATASTFSNFEYYIPNYSAGIYKSYSVDSAQENNAQIAINSFAGGLWSNTSAITSITFDLNNGDFVQFSTFTLYGIKNARKTAGNSVKAIGGNISFDGTYVVHTFNSSGIFTPTAALTADYLVVAGGGGGGGNVDGSATSSGGGGAGGLRCTVTATGGGGSLESRISLIPFNNYAVTVGAGGAAGDYYAGQQYGGDGSNSAFYTITSVGGGGGGYVPGTGRNGGSGGGGYASNSGGTGTANQGFNGAAGGGGGAGEAGGTDSAREGGDGVTTLISGTSVTYAGGGGGGNGFAGGTGGGGAGGTSGNGVAGTVNTGGGGGGAYQGGSPGKLGGAGGSGIVIIRYKA